jgi:outer membrane beta-barrel protein
MRKIILLCVIISGAFSVSDISKPQEDFEKSIQAVVRNKIYYKTGHIELNAVAGMMPYESLVTDFMFGGRVAWHLSDHYGWEIIDGLWSIPTVNSYAKDTVVANDLKPTGAFPNGGIFANKLKLSLCTNFLISPFYGKIKFFGTQSLFFDIYFLVGAGLSQMENVQIYNSGGTAVETTVSNTWDITVPVGLGFKVFLNPGMGLLIDLRNYFSYSSLYNQRYIKGSFSAFIGLSFFIPTLG